MIIIEHQEDDAPVEYIKRDSALTYIALSYAMTDLDTDRMTCHALFEMIKSEPAADVAPVRHGRWIHKKDKDWMGGWKTVCSVCESGLSDGGYIAARTFPYCPICGAKMDGGGDHAEEV